MSILTIAFPIQAVIPVAQNVLGTAATFARPLIGLSALIALLFIFKPLVLGLMRAALLALKPRRSLNQRNAKALRRLEKQAERLQPNLSAELRFMASRY